jgi:CheY-like chemotaxis protein
MVGTEDLRLLTELLQAVSWPLVVFAVLLYFGPLLREMLADAQEVSVSGAGFETTIKRQFRSGALYGLALAQKSGDLSPEEIEREIRNEADEVAAEGDTPAFAGTRLLWVDDDPSNNIYERGALEEKGVRITTSTSTEDALERIESHDFDVIISDMGRSEGRRAGYSLLERKQEMGDRTPFIVYSGSGKEEHRREARRRGAVGATNRPQELFQLVRQAITE